MSLSLLLPHSRVPQGPHPIKGALRATMLFAARVRVSHMCAVCCCRADMDRGLDDF